MLVDDEEKTSPAAEIGTVQAPDAASTIQAAIKKYDITDPVKQARLAEYRPMKTLDDVAERVKRCRATALYFDLRARRDPRARERFAAEAERYRKLAQELEELALPPRKPPALSP